jgi:hypothetical protein
MALHIVVHPRFGDTARVATEATGRPQLAVRCCRSSSPCAISHPVPRVRSAIRSAVPAMRSGPGRVRERPGQIRAHASTVMHNHRRLAITIEGGEWDGCE